MRTVRAVCCYPSSSVCNYRPAESQNRTRIFPGPRLQYTGKLVSEPHLQKISPEFAGWWQDFESHGGGNGAHHANKTALPFDFTTFHPRVDPSLKVAIYTPI